jgi:2,4-dienoyl-CoA reductase-like NADH-dependent reductase (Old Yellow Enzyme family)
MYPDPKEMTETDIDDVVDAFIASAKRAEQAGCEWIPLSVRPNSSHISVLVDFIEVHGAHGYLIHSFLSPLSNKRNDAYGGQSLENRARLVYRVVERLRKVWSKPLFVRISATDWAEGPEKDSDGKWLQWGIEQSTIVAARLQELGADLIDCSTGGNWARQKIPVGPSYQVGSFFCLTRTQTHRDIPQVPFAAQLKKALPDLLVGTVGLITEAEQAESILKEGKADVVLLARALLRDPHWPLHAAQKLGVKIKPAGQYERAWAAL